MTEHKINIDAFKKENIPILKEIMNDPVAKKIAKEEGVFMEKTSSHNIQNLLVILGFGFLLIFATIPFLIYQGYTKSEMSQNVSLNPKFESNVSVNNDYAFSPTTNNEYKQYIDNNSTIYVNNFIPENLCG